MSLSDMQDFARHADPRTTRRYDRARHALDRHATYAITHYLAGGARNVGPRTALAVPGEEGTVVGDGIRP